MTLHDPFARLARIALGMLVLLIPSCKHTTPSSAPPLEIEAIRAGAPLRLDETQSRVLVERVDKALAVCNFSSEKKPQIFGEDLTELWKKREAASHLRLRYAKPKTIEAVAGKLRFNEVLLSLGEPYGPEPALIKDDARIIGLQMCGYDDRLLGCAPELASVFPPPPACPPGF